MDYHISSWDFIARRHADVTPDLEFDMIFFTRVYIEFLWAFSSVQDFLRAINIRTSCLSQPTSLTGKFVHDSSLAANEADGQA